jgi:ADP-ribose pyrophosphatase
MNQLSNPELEQEHFRGKFLSLRSAGRWEFVRRVNSSGVIAIVAITPENEIILVRQVRPPLGAMVLELPAGLVGDDPGDEQESNTSAAERELFEETGYRAGKMVEVFTGASSAGLTDEVITFFLATELILEGPGGGVENESIETVVVPLAEVDQYVIDATKAGCQIDVKLFTGLYLACRALSKIKFAEST